MLHWSSVLWVFGLSGITGVSLIWQWTKGELQTNPLLWRAFGIWYGHHSVILFMITGLFSLFVWKGLKPIVAVVGVWFVISVHESIWWVTDSFAIWLTVVDVPGFQPWWWFGWLLMAAVATFFVWSVVMEIPVPWKFVLFVGEFYVVWFSLGFPVTVNFDRTVFYDSLAVNGLEVLSWVWALAWSWFLISDLLLRWQKGLKL